MLSLRLVIKVKDSCFCWYLQYFCCCWYYANTKKQLITVNFHIVGHLIMLEKRLPMEQQLAGNPIQRFPLANTTQ